MDKGGCKLSLEGHEVIRNVETQGRKHVHNCVICSPSAVQAVANVVEQYRIHIVPYAILNLPHSLGGGERVFSTECAIKVPLKASDLNEQVKERRITLPSSCDTMVVSKNVNFMMAGVNINDRSD
jgi:hypothetical protein